MAGTDRTKKNIRNGPAIILMAPQLGENIGMAARAMANFGLHDLRIIKPREAFPSEKAISAASKADYIINEAKLYDNLSNALADLSYVYATSARKRDSYKEIVSPKYAMQQAKQLIDNRKKVGILFGRERVGLLNNELSLTDSIITFPVNRAYASLNLAQAVLLISYEWMQTSLDDELSPIFSAEILQQAEKHSLYSFFSQIETALECRGYFRPKERTEIMKNNLRDVLTRPNFSEQEIRLLRGVIASLENFVPKDTSNE